MTQEPKWECFSDPSYFDMWCVRRVGDRTFGQGFHLVRQESAEALCDYLNGIPDPEAQWFCMKEKTND